MKSALLTLVFLAAGLVLVTTDARAQDSDFFFDTESDRRIPLPDGPSAGERARAAVSAPVDAPISWNAVPLAGYSPETQFMFGGFGVTYFRLGKADPGSRPSYVAANAIYTTRGQAMVDLYPEFWFGDERVLVRGQFSYRSMPDYYYGIGNANPRSAEESYTLHTYWQTVQARARVWDRLFVGLREDLQIHEILDPELAGRLTNGDVVGAEGGIRSGFGLELNYDSRDNALAPHTGGFYQAFVNSFQPWMGSRWTYTRFNLDARHYFALSSRQTLAVQLYGDFNFGNVPFHQLAMLGGNVRLRGLYEGRFRDLNAITAQVEWRMMPVFWRFGLVAFAAVGQAFDAFRSIRWNGIHWTLGAGIRFALNPEERTHIRLDFGAGLDSWGIYFNVLEAF